MLLNKKKLKQAMRHAKSYQEWKAAALAYDERSGLDRWKYMDQSRRYDYASIRTRLDRLRNLRTREDDVGLLFALNEGIHGNMGGMGQPALYGKATFGTKQLISDYVDEIVAALEHLACPATAEIRFEEKLEFFRRASHCFGRSALMMSGAGTLLYFHLGVVKALWEQDLLPTVMSGASGGALVCSLLGTHTHEELDKIFEPAHLVAEIRRETKLWKNVFGIKLQTLQLSEIHEMLERLIPDLTFQEAFERTGRQINVSVGPAEAQQTSRLLNAITSPNVCIREALMASVALPGIYPPVGLAAKNVHGERQAYLPSRKWTDGSLHDDLPAKRLARLYGVNHYIASQTNPLVLPFVTDNKLEQGALSILRRAGQRTLKEWVDASAALMHKPLNRRPRLNKLVHTLTSVIRQDYTADINILPPTRLFNPLKLLALRSEKEVMGMIRAGEKSTWPKLEMIRINTRISCALDGILTAYEEEFLAQKVSKTG
jgi:NTE family protein